MPFHLRRFICAGIVMLSLHSVARAGTYEYVTDTENDDSKYAPAISASANHTYDFSGSGSASSGATYQWVPDDEFDMPDSRRTRQTVLCTTQSLSASGNDGTARARNTFYIGSNYYDTGLEEVQNGMPASYRAEEEVDHIAPTGDAIYPQWDNDLMAYFLNLSDHFDCTNVVEVIVDQDQNIAAAAGVSTIQTQTDSVRPYPL